jgi:hypothetical protein
MNNLIQHSGQDQFANGQSSRDLRVNSDVTELQAQLDLNATEQRDRVNEFQLEEGNMTVRKFEIERLSVTSSKPFAAVVAAIKASV